MLSIQLQDIGKRYKNEWIIRHCDLDIAPGQHYAVEGRNGAGKSTFLQLLAGYLSPSQGQIRAQLLHKDIPREDIYTVAALAAPYTSLIEELTATEAFEFQAQFKSWGPDIDTPTAIQSIQFTRQNLQKPIKYFSSGMRQRVKLALALLSNTPLLLLDEPTITLDNQGSAWFMQLLQQHSHFTHQQERLPRTVVVASNVQSDFQTCSQSIDLMQFKPKKN